MVVASLPRRSWIAICGLLLLSGCAAVESDPARELYARIASYQNLIAKLGRPLPVSSLPPYSADEMYLGYTENSDGTLEHRVGLNGICVFAFEV